ncbi:preprotein translocase subunit SecE [Corynebacterium uberis]|uniref:preprotein translocase subunit SecE n=1 Tax=Corynebacterium TaxID=1716 RepID=UPI001D0B441E|nr:preprotein translocase subunit SecE [Corynebacterium uberis]MCZ9309460.1 preprotein translocase subunit SecE [Corynebacterium sp. c6VSa_13]UDL73009.1 preprotein translocase subunit SecE [Corynebacterium uberis]UDL76114.1 preprotein translocase subunit SecE [Corynebacterium uberis]UDL78326.1 preprotein translocase subunit SecE [Corynebacterium uberis]UDL80609.1 preprotein translocase subunit SecE [Corynebacterium uberis]
MSEERGNLTPTGKRQRTGASTVTSATYQSKQVAKTARDDENPGGGPLRYLPEVASEMKKVIWPTASQMVTYTLVVFAFLIVLTALVSGVDFLAGLGVEKVLVNK